MRDLIGSQRRWMRVGGDVLPGPGAGEDPGSLVLHVLEPVQGSARYPRQDSITVV